MRYAALLRGINVGGRKKVPMAALRAMLADLGYADVVTHLQSGNAAFTSPQRPQALARAIAERIAGELAPPQAEADALTSMTFDPDQIWISGAEAFLWCPDGVAETRLSNNFLEKRLKVTATSRNWNTVLKLAELTRG